MKSSVRAGPAGSRVRSITFCTGCCEDIIGLRVFKSSACMRGLGALRPATVESVACVGILEDVSAFGTAQEEWRGSLGIS